MTDLINSGIELMFIGMGIVFVFLTMLVLAINLMSSLVQRFFPEPPIVQAPIAAAKGIDKSTIAAISAAVHQYRGKHNKVS